MRPTATPLLLIVLALLLAGCAPTTRPIPLPFSSPLAAPHYDLYLPLTVSPIRLGQGVTLTHTDQFDSCQDAGQLSVAWAYDWSATPPQCPNQVALPMIWRWRDVGRCPVVGQGPLILLFNEPDRPDQANLPPEFAAEMTRHLTETCFPTRRFATPAVLATDNYSGLAWLDAWWNAHVARYGAPPRTEIVAFHCFSWSTADVCVARLEAAIQWSRAHQLRGVLITEFAVLPCVIGDARAIAEAEALTYWMATQPEILGWAWTSTRIQGEESWWFKPAERCNTGLFDFTTGALTPYGRWYAHTDHE